MTTVGKPDLAEYRTRLSQILPTIGITLPTGWTTSDVAIFKAPGLGHSDYPFWVIGRPEITSSREAVRIRRWRISWVMFLARDDNANTEIAETLADNVDDDVADVMEYFESRSEFVSTTLTANQAGYLPGSLSLAVNPDAIYPINPQGTHLLYGSAYTLSLTHRVVYDRQYR